MEMVTTPEEYVSKQSAENQKILKQLRAILLASALEEKMKWGIPTYCLENKNVAGIGGFKNYSGLWFFNGSFLKDKYNVLLNAQEGKTKGMRQWRFYSFDEIKIELINEYLVEAIENQKLGKEVKPEKKPLLIPDELKEALASDSMLSEKFDALSLSRRKEYAEHIVDAKRSETKQKRLAKIIPMIMEGLGLNDKYR